MPWIPTQNHGLINTDQFYQLDVIDLGKAGASLVGRRSDGRYLTILEHPQRRVCEEYLVGLESAINAQNPSYIGPALANLMSHLLAEAEAEEPESPAATPGCPACDPGPCTCDDRTVKAAR